MAADSRAPGAFPTTRWTLVVRAGDRDAEAWVEALDELLRLYTPVLKSHLVTFEHVSPERADDFLQGFVTAKILEKDTVVAEAKAARGRFRSFLLKAFRNYCISQFRRERAQKRAPERAELSLSEKPDALAYDAGFEAAFNLEWIRELLEKALTRMRAECEEKQRADVWGIFEQRLIGPMVEGTSPPAYDELMRRFEFASPSRAMNVLVTAKRMFQRVLFEAILDTVGDEDQARAELEEIKAILGNADAGRAGGLRSTG
jgi:DNA-directed RNA polymerase specialized sigma24 family protein